MSYGLIYTLPFASRDGRAYEVRIEREGYTGESRELKGQTSPFTVTIDSEEFIYTPTRFSTATLAIFGGDYLQDLFSTDYRMHRVTLYADGVAVWCGFIKPEMYTQDYSSIKFNLEVNCYSAMSVLEFVEYKQSGEERGFVSLWSLLKKCIEESKGKYSAIYLPHVYGLSQSDYNSWNNPLESMMVSEQNFFDEDDNAMSLLEVLKEIMKLMNWTCADWRGELYFIDVDNETGEYFRYTADLASYTQVQADEMNVQEIGFAGSDHTLDILGGYNKASVRCSNYPVGDALPELSFDNMVFLGERTTWGGKNQEYYYKYLRSIGNIDTIPYLYENGDLRVISLEEEKEMDFSGEEQVPLLGCIPRQFQSYETDDNGNPLIVDYDLTSELWMMTEEGLFPANNTIPFILIKGVSAAYQDGVFYINFTTKMSSYLPKLTLSSYDFHFRLRVGSKYFHGNSTGEYIWNNSPETDSTYSNNLLPDWGDTPPEQIDFTGKDKSYPLITSRKLGDGLDGLSGFICPIPEGVILSGELELEIFAPCTKWYYDNQDYDLKEYVTLLLTDFEFGYRKYEYAGDDSDSDRIYENIVNENYINELDEIEFKISSYNDDGACYSKVTIGDGYLTNNLYTGITGENIRPEEFLIRRIVDHYGASKIKLAQVIKKADIKPYTVLSDNYSVNKKYINAGGEIDYRKNRFSCIMIEI